MYFNILFSALGTLYCYFYSSYVYASHRPEDAKPCVQLLGNLGLGVLFIMVGAHVSGFSLVRLGISGLKLGTI